MYGANTRRFSVIAMLVMLADILLLIFYDPWGVSAFSGLIAISIGLVALGLSLDSGRIADSSDKKMRDIADYLFNEKLAILSGHLAAVRAMPLGTDYVNQILSDLEATMSVISWMPTAKRVQFLELIGNYIEATKQSKTMYFDERTGQAYEDLISRLESYDVMVSKGDKQMTKQNSEIVNRTGVQKRKPLMFAIYVIPLVISITAIILSYLSYQESHRSGEFQRNIVYDVQAELLRNMPLEVISPTSLFPAWTISNKLANTSAIFKSSSNAASKPALALTAHSGSASPSVLHSVNRSVNSSRRASEA